MKYTLAIKACLLASCIFFPVFEIRAQNPVIIDSTINEHIFTGQQISYIEDVMGNKGFDEIRTLDRLGKFSNSLSYYPEIRKPHIVYWYKVRIHFKGSPSVGQSLIEFFDQTADSISAYLPIGGGKFKQVGSGAKMPFARRDYSHKNFEFLIPEHFPGENIYYLRVSSSNQINVIIVYRTTKRFIDYALIEYLSYGLFYGMIIIFCLNHFLIFIATRLIQYIYYVLYMISVGIYEMSADGLAFQFLWPYHPAWNQYAYGTALFSTSIFALLFTKKLLDLPNRNKTLSRCIDYAIVIRTVYFLFCLVLRKEWFVYSAVELAPLLLAFYCGWDSFKKGFSPARFFLGGYLALFFGATLKVITVLGFARWLPGAMGHYSMGFGFILEMVLLSFSISEQVRAFKKEKIRAEQHASAHLMSYVQLQRDLHQRLKTQVEIRTRGLFIKSEKLRLEVEGIEQKNMMLEGDNNKLKSGIEHITEARIASAVLSFEEFSIKFPDRERCYSFIAGLKWQNGFACRKCGHESASTGQRPHSRRCRKCFYEESPLNDTIFENQRLPINKALYILYLIHTTDGKISSYQIAEKLQTRQSTCWSYARRIRDLMDESKFKSGKQKKPGWEDLILKGVR